MNDIERADLLGMSSVDLDDARAEVDGPAVVDGPDYFRNERLEMVRVTMCRDCVLITANGETSDGFDYDTWAENVERLWPHADGWHAGNGWSDPDEEAWFSWSACEMCDSPLGGDREYGHMARTITD